MTNRLYTINTNARVRGVVGGIVALLLSAAPLYAQGAPPRPTRPPSSTDSLPAPAQAPSPSLHAPISGPAALQRATPAVVVAPGAGSPAPVPPRQIAAAPTQVKAPPGPPSDPVGPPPRLAAIASPAVTARAKPDGPPPTGATMRCKDGTYFAGTPNETNCADHHGVAAVFSASVAPKGPGHGNQT